MPFEALDAKQDWPEGAATLLRKAIHERNSQAGAVISASLRGLRG